MLTSALLYIQHCIQFKWVLIALWNILSSQYMFLCFASKAQSFLINNIWEASHGSLVATWRENRDKEPAHLHKRGTMFSESLNFFSLWNSLPIRLLHSCTTDKVLTLWPALEWRINKASKQVMIYKTRVSNIESFMQAFDVILQTSKEGKTSFLWYTSSGLHGLHAYTFKWTTFQYIWTNCPVSIK